MGEGEQVDEKTDPERKSINWWPISIVLIVAILTPLLYVLFVNGTQDIPIQDLLPPLRIIGIIALVVAITAAAIFVFLPLAYRREGPEKKDVNLWPISILLIVAIVVPVSYVLMLWLMSGIRPAEILLSVLLVIGVIALIVALAFTTAVFQSLGLADKTQTLGLPEGSIRAVIALSLILIFMISSLFLYWQVADSNIEESYHISQDMLNNIPPEDIAWIRRVEPRDNESAVKEPLFNVGRIVEKSQTSEDIAKQIITTVSTLVVAVAGFYFGTRAVSVAAGAAAKSEPVIRSISPDKGKPGADISFTISGKNFELGEEGKVKLLRDKTEIPCRDILSSSSEITGKFIVPPDSKADTKLSVVVTNADKGEDRLEDAFTVTAS